MSKLKFEYGYPSPKHIKEFENYLLMFYGPDPLHDAVYPEVGMTEEDAKKVTETYLNGDYESTDKGFHLWGGGDTVDREFCRDVIFEKMMRSDND
tara:strand:+ start:194 stop:478 length:285 start_codon:yes stop_codon:yes gene_type:complete